MTHGVSAIALAGSGDVVAAISADPKHSLFVWHWPSGTLLGRAAAAAHSGYLQPCTLKLAVPGVFLRCCCMPAYELVLLHQLLQLFLCFFAARRCVLTKTKKDILKCPCQN